MLRDAAERAVGARARQASRASRSRRSSPRRRGWDGQAAERRERDVARLVARHEAPRRGGQAARPAGRPAAVGGRARARSRALRDAGVRVVVLDECHHLLSLWGALLKAVLELLEPEHVLGLTATNPRDVTAEQAALYAAAARQRGLLRADARRRARRATSRPTRSSSSSARRCTPSTSGSPSAMPASSSRSTQLADVPAGAEHLGLDAWLRRGCPSALAAGGGPLSWAELARRQPRLADAGLRWLHARGARRAGRRAARRAASRGADDRRLGRAARGLRAALPARRRRARRPRGAWTRCRSRSATSASR